MLGPLGDQKELPNRIRKLFLQDYALVNGSLTVKCLRWTEQEFQVPAGDRVPHTYIYIYKHNI